MKPKEIMLLMNWFCLVVSSVAGLALEQVYNTSHNVVRRVATDQADPCLPSNHHNISHIGQRHINVRGSCPYTDGRLEDAWYYAGPNPISSYRHIPEMCSCGYKFPIWMNGSMPGVEEGVVSRTTCMRFGPFTCDQTINIQIKNCGNDFVYHLSATPDDAGYCFDVTTASLISSASSPSTVSSTITTSLASREHEPGTASSTSTGTPHTNVSSSRSTSHATARSTENAATSSGTSPYYTSSSTSVTRPTPQSATTSTESTSTLGTSPYYTKSSTTVTKSTSQTATTSTDYAKTTNRTSPYTTPNSSDASSTTQTASTSTEKYNELKTTVATRLTSFPWLLSTTNSSWYDVTSADAKTTNRTSPYTTPSSSDASSTSQTASTGTEKYSELKTTVATRLTSFPWLLSTTNSSWYDVTSAGTKLRDAIFVNCDELGWNIRIDMNRLIEIYPNAKSSDVYLGENHCTGVLSSNTLIFQQGLKECLTSQTVRENAIVYSNRLVYAERDPNFTFIIRHYNWSVGVECDVQRNETSSGHIHHESNNMAHPIITGNSHFSVNMSFYSDPNFMYQLQGNPLHANVGDNVYVTVYTTTSDWTVKMRVHTCYTKPEQYSPDHMKYYIIQNGCAVDRNTHIISESTHETRFVFQDFEYTSNHEGIHVFCDAVFCGSYDTSRQCQQTCTHVVRRRNIAIEITGKK